jgi:hypothetical protein
MKMRRRMIIKKHLDQNTVEGANRWHSHFRKIITSAGITVAFRLTRVDKRELLREGLNDLFTKHGKPPIA